jgi:nucleotide-binding universal stress UspA family protein
MIMTKKEASMVEIKNILCAVDFSEVSSRLASYTQTLAKGLNAKVHVLFVTSSLEESGTFYIPSPSIWDPVGGTVANLKTMDTFIQENFSNVEVKAKVLEGDAKEKILSFADDENIDMIIIGTHGRTGVEKIIFGSIAEKVVKSSKVPVLTIRPN